MGSNCSESGSIPLVEVSEEEGCEVVCGVFEDGGGRGTRLYFLLEGWMSASSSSRKDCNSFSAASSREMGLGGGVSDDKLVDCVAVCEDAGMESPCGGATGVDQSQPIVMKVYIQLTF